MYSAGAYVSYINMNNIKTHIQPPDNKNNICSQIAYNTRISYRYSKEFYVNNCHPAVYTGAWPVIQFTMSSLSLFTGVLSGYLEWHEKNNK